MLFLYQQFMLYVVAENRLDVLVNNAGVMQLSKKREVTRDGFELHLGVNYLGNLLQV